MMRKKRHSKPSRIATHGGSEKKVLLAQTMPSNWTPKRSSPSVSVLLRHYRH